MTFSDKYSSSQGAQNWSVNCWLDEAVVYMREQCNGHTECHISAEVFREERDPCPGTERYLEAHYRCAPQQGTVPYSTIQYSTIQYSTVQYRLAPQQGTGNGTRFRARGAIDATGSLLGFE